MVSASSQQAISLRQERTAVFKNIDKLQQKKMEIVSVIKTKGNDAKEIIENGMNFKEVLALVGQPRAKTRDRFKRNNQSWNYGIAKSRLGEYYEDVWVSFNSGIVFAVGKYQFHDDEVFH